MTRRHRKPDSGKRPAAADGAEKTGPMVACVRDGADGVALLDVRLQPGASRSALEGVVGGRLRARVQAPPVEGAANEALCRLLAKALGISKSKVRIARGETSREKTLEIECLDARAVAKALGL